LLHKRARYLKIAQIDEERKMSPLYLATGIVNLARHNSCDLLLGVPKEAGIDLHQSLQECQLSGEHTWVGKLEQHQQATLHLEDFKKKE
jgi:hypothetical protein